MCEYRTCGSKIITERTGFKPGDKVPEWCARVHLPDGGFEFAYGETERAAVDALMRKERIQAEVSATRRREEELERDAAEADNYHGK